MRYDLKKQEKPDYCFVACLQAVLNRRGFRVSQEAIAVALNIRKNGFLVSEPVLNNYIAKFNLKSKIWEARTYPLGDLDLIEEKLRAGIDNIVQVDTRRLYSGLGEHFVLIDEIKRNGILIANPENAKLESYDLADFLKSARNGCYVLIG